MQLKIYTPAFPLNQFVECFIYYKDYTPDHCIDRLLPDGNVNIIIDLTNYPKFIYHNDTLKEIQTCKNVWFSGIRSKYITIPSGKDSEMFVINFHKGKAYPFVSMPLNELADKVVDGEQVLSGEIINLREKLQSASGIQSRFQIAEQYFLRYYGQQLIENPFVSYAVNKILATPTLQSIAQIAREVGYSQKHLIQIFKEHVGLGPKHFLKVIRFQKAIEDLGIVPVQNLTAVALDCGYYDQAHFINDFKEFSGFTPKEYLRKQYDYLNYVPVE